MSLLKLWLLEGSLFFQPGPILYRTGALQAIGAAPALPSVSDFELLSPLLHVEGRGEGLYSGCDLISTGGVLGGTPAPPGMSRPRCRWSGRSWSRTPTSGGLRRLRRLERGDASLIFSQRLFSERWRVESGKPGTSSAPSSPSRQRVKQPPEQAAQSLRLHRVTSERRVSVLPATSLLTHPAGGSGPGESCHCSLLPYSGGRSCADTGYKKPARPDHI